VIEHKNRGIWIILILMIIVMLVLSFLIGYLINGNKTSKKGGNIIEPPPYDKPNSTNKATFEMKTDYINYILYELKAYELHNPPMSSGKPIIKFDVDGKIYSSYIEENNIYTIKESLENKYIKFITTKDVIMN